MKKAKTFIGILVVIAPLISPLQVFAFLYSEDFEKYELEEKPKNFSLLCGKWVVVEADGNKVLQGDVQMIGGDCMLQYNVPEAYNLAESFIQADVLFPEENTRNAVRIVFRSSEIIHGEMYEAGLGESNNIVLYRWDWGAINELADEPLPLDFVIEAGECYTFRFHISGPGKDTKIKFWIFKVEEDVEPPEDPVFEFTDKEGFDSGTFGFVVGSGALLQFDNVFASDWNFPVKKDHGYFFPVAPRGRLAITWGSIKTSY